LSEESWVFVEDGAFTDERLSSRILPPERNLTFVRDSRLRVDISVLEGRVINHGPDPSQVSDATVRAITEHQLRPARSPGRHEALSGSLYVYNPDVSDAEAAEPPREAELDEVDDLVTERKIDNYRKQGEQPVEAEIRRLQDRELEKLEESQRREVERLEDLTQERIRRAENEAERETVVRERTERLNRTKERHETEKSRITKRHVKEREKVAGSSAGAKKKK
jgi:hypothetical protein